MEVPRRHSPLGLRNTGMETTTTNPVLKPEVAESIREEATAKYEEVRKEARQYTADSIRMIRRNPTESALASFGVGFLLAQLPLGFIAAGLVRLAFAALKPAALIYSVYKFAQEFGYIPQQRPPSVEGK